MVFGQQKDKLTMKKVIDKFVFVTFANLVLRRCIESASHTSITQVIITAIQGQDVDGGKCDGNEKTTCVMN